VRLKIFHLTGESSVQGIRTEFKDEVTKLGKPPDTENRSSTTESTADLG
jgi:hypothetical protein